MDNGPSDRMVAASSTLRKGAVPGGCGLAPAWSDASEAGVAAEAGKAATAEYPQSQSWSGPLPPWVSPTEFGGAGTPSVDAWKGQVTLRIEAMSSREVKITTYISSSLAILALGVAIAQAVLKVKVDPNWLESGRPPYFTSSLGLAVGMTTLQLGTMLRFLWRVRRARRRGMRWSFRRKRIAGFVFAFAVVQLLSLAFWLGSMGAIVARPCSWLNAGPRILGGLQWSMLNAQLLMMLVGAHSTASFAGATRALPRSLRQKMYAHDSTLMLDVHWLIQMGPKLVFWALVEALIINLTVALGGYIDKGLAAGQQAAGSETTVCPPLPDTCPINTTRVYLLVAAVSIYALWFFLLVYFTARSLRQRPFQQTKAARILTALQVREMVLVQASIVLAVPLILGVQVQSCWNYLVGWVALLPPHIVGTACSMVLLYVFMPRNVAKSDYILQAWLEEFCWTEAGLPAALEARNRYMAGLEKLKKQPMFVVETCVKLLYWSRLAYDVEEAEPSLFSTEHACKLMGLDQVELVWERLTDSKAVVGWQSAGDKLVIAFKGTSSRSNVMTDLKLFQVVHEPKRRVWTGIRHQIVKVHQGFREAWEGNGYSVRLLGRLEEIVGSMGRSMSDVHIYLTGHSLGGAMASMCAHALKMRHPSAKLTVYTFGAPRVGSRAFAVEYESLVADHWTIIRENDPVPRIPAPGYKRHGHRVLLNRSDLIIRPSYLELSVFTGRGVVSDHLLEKYRTAIAAVIKAQFKRGRGVPHGREGATALARALDLNAALVCLGLDPESLADTSTRPMTLERLQARQWWELLLPCAPGKADMEADASTAGGARNAAAKLQRGADVVVLSEAECGEVHRRQDAAMGEIAEAAAGIDSAFAPHTTAAVTATAEAAAASLGHVPVLKRWLSAPRHGGRPAPAAGTARERLPADA